MSRSTKKRRAVGSAGYVSHAGPTGIGLGQDKSEAFRKKLALHCCIVLVMLGSTCFFGSSALMHLQKDAEEAGKYFEGIGVTGNELPQESSEAEEWQKPNNATIEDGIAEALKEANKRATGIE